MKKNILLLGFLFSVCIMQAQTVIVDEEFDGTSAPGKLGIFSMNNYQTDVADWSYEIDAYGMISGDNSDYINVFNSGTEWWALQVRTDEFPGQQQGDIFEVSFKAASSVATAFDFKAQGQLDFTYRVELPGNEEVKDFKFQTTPMDGNGFIVFFFALGKVPAGEYWFDAVKIVRKDETAIGHIALTENAPYTVYNLSGLAVARGITNGEAIATDNLASGVYILKTANRILKFVKQ